MLFCIENPATGCLKAQPFMSALEPHMRVCDYCAYQTLHDGEWVNYRFRKPTALWTNVAFEARRCRCPGQRHASSIVGDKARGKRGDHGQGRTPPMHYKHAVPTELRLLVLRRAMEASAGTWVLDLFSGTQSLKRACDLLGLGYVSVDIQPRVKTCEGHVTTHIVRDLRGADLGALVREGAELLEVASEDLLMVWMSPDCRTYSQAQTLCPLGRRHRDYSKARRPPLTDAARESDATVANLVNQL